MKILCINCKPNFKYFIDKGLILDTEFKTISNLKFPLLNLGKVQNTDGSMVDMVTPDISNYIKTNYPTFQYNVIMVGYKPGDYDSSISNLGGYTYPDKLSNGTRLITVRQDFFPQNMYPLHEMMHTLDFIINVDFGDHVPKDFMDKTPVNGKWLPYYKNDPSITDPDSNFNQTWKWIVPFLDRLNLLLTNKEPMTTYKYFSAKEIVGLKPELVAILDKMRGECGFPFKINSGYRTIAQNASLSDAVSDSAHLLGLAVDLSITDSSKRFKLIQVALANGINRIGAGSTFIHLDISKTLPQGVLWTY